jgi:hypothetical protein
MTYSTVMPFVFVVTKSSKRHHTTISCEHSPARASRLEVARVKSFEGDPRSLTQSSFITVFRLWPNFLLCVHRSKGNTLNINDQRDEKDETNSINPGKSFEDGTKAVASVWQGRIKDATDPEPHQGFRTLEENNTGGSR